MDRQIVNSLIMIVNCLEAVRDSRKGLTGDLFICSGCQHGLLSHSHPDCKPSRFRAQKQSLQHLTGDCLSKRINMIWD